MENVDRFVTPKTAADLLRANFGHGSPKTLAKLRTTGGGPHYHKMGRHVFYKSEDVLNWARSKLGPALSSTSDKFQAAEQKNAAA